LAPLLEELKRPVPPDREAEVKREVARLLGEQVLFADPARFEPVEDRWERVDEDAEVVEDRWEPVDALEEPVPDDEYVGQRRVRRLFFQSFS
jgi:hypothetical protein